MSEYDYVAERHDAWADEADYLDSAGADRRERDRIEQAWHAEDCYGFPTCDGCGWIDSNLQWWAGPCPPEDAPHQAARSEAGVPFAWSLDDSGRIEAARAASIKQARQRTAHLWAGDPIVAEHEPAFDVQPSDDGHRMTVTLDGRTVTMTTEHATFFARCIYDEVEAWGAR